MQAVEAAVAIKESTIPIVQVPVPEAIIHKMHKVLIKVIVVQVVVAVVIILVTSIKVVQALTELLW